MNPSHSPTAPKCGCQLGGGGGGGYYSQVRPGYVRTGGREPTEQELRIWHSTNVGVNYQRVRDTMVAQLQPILLERGTHRPVQNVDGNERNRNPP